MDRPDLRAFLFWSRAPFVTPAPDGDGLVFSDARYYDELARDRFSVQVKGIACE
jgi:inner membrane protein